MSGRARQVAVWVVVWVLTRALIVGRIGLGGGLTDAEIEDVAYFRNSAEYLATNGSIPEGDAWQYPPGAAFLFLLPRLVPVTYPVAFIALMLLADVVGFVALIVLARREGRTQGVWLWLLGMPLLSVFPVLRFDLVPTVLAVVALVLVPRQSALLVGALAGLGAAVKVWPLAVLLAEADRRRLRLAATGAVVVLVAVFAVGWAAFGGQAAFFSNQGHRGLQAEAVAASPWHLRASLTHTDVEYVQRNGTLEIADPVADGLATGLEWFSVVAALAVLAWWVARDRAIHRAGRVDLAEAAAGRDAVLTAVLLAVVLSRVLSPQFMIWLLGLAAVVLSTRGSRLHRPAWVVALAVALTSGMYAAHANFVFRNIVLVVALVDAVVIMVRSVRTAPGPTGGPSGGSATGGGSAASGPSSTEAVAVE